MAMVVLVLLGGLLFNLGSADAAPATPFDFRSCVNFTDENGDVFEFCLQSKGVVQFVATPSGNTQQHIVREDCIDRTRNGAFLENTCEKTQTVSVVKDGQSQVDLFKRAFDRTFDFDGTLFRCAESVNVILVNGEVRHEVTKPLACSPV